MDKLSDFLPQRVDPEEQQRYITQEFQDYGYRLAVELGEEHRKAMYIKLAKDKPRALLEMARSYVTDYPQAKNRGKLFLWKMKQLEIEAGGGKSLSLDKTQNRPVRTGRKSEK